MKDIRFLLKKFLRELPKEYSSQLLSLIIIVSVGIACFIGFSKSYSDLDESFSNYYSSSNLEDLEVSGIFSPEKEKKIQKLAGISKIDRNYDYKAKVKDTTLIVNGFSEKDNINKPTLLTGKYPGDNEIAVDELYFKKNHLKIGSKISATINGIKAKVKISGSIRSPKFLYLTENASEPVPNHRKYGYSIIRKSDLKKIGFPINSLVIKMKDGENIDKLIDKIHNIDSNSYVIRRKDLQSFKMIQSKLETIKSISVSISAVFIILTIAITLISYSKQVSNKKPEIALLKALGISQNKILTYLFLPGITTAIIGTILGALIGFMVFPYIIKKTLETLFDFPPIVHSNYSISIIGSFIAILLVEFFALIISSNKLLRESAANTMCRTINKVRANSFLEKITFVWSHISFKTKLLIRNISAGKIKFFLSALSIAFSITLLISSFGLKFALGDIEKAEFESTRNYDLSATLTPGFPFNLNPKSDSDMIFTDNYSIVPAKIKNFDTHLNIIDRKAKSINLVSNNKEPLSFDRLHGTYISEKMAKKFSFKKGDSIKLKLFIDNNYHDFKTVLKGVYTSYTGQGFYTTFSYLNTKNLAIPVQTQYIKTRNISKEKKKLTENSAIKNVLLKDKQAKNYQDASKSVNSILLIIVIIAALLLFAIIYNISSINISERKRDIATEKVLGLSSAEINKLLLGENAILVVVSTIIGIIVSPLIYNLLGNAIASDEMSFPTNLNLVSIPISIGLIVLFLGLTSIFLVVKIQKIDKLSALNEFA